MAAIEINNLTKSFDGFKAVDDVSFSLEENRILGFLGPNGAGKTTTIRMIVGLSKPSTGEIKIAGQNVIFGDSSVNKLFGYLPEQPAFYGWMTGKEYLEFVTDIFKIKNKDKKITELLKMVDLTEAKSKKIRAYSNGMKQRLGIAQAIINDPKVLIMDEPVSALDPIGRREVLAIISSLKKQMTIMLSTHILSDVDRVCDDIAIINKGKLITYSGLEELKTKYASQIIEVEFEKSPSDLIPELKKQPWAIKVEQNNRLVKIWIKDTKIIDNNVAISFFAKSDLAILNFGLKLPEVEDLFVTILEDQK